MPFVGIERTRRSRSRLDSARRSHARCPPCGTPSTRLRRSFPAPHRRWPARAGPNTSFRCPDHTHRGHPLELPRVWEWQRREVTRSVLQQRLSARQRARRAPCLVPLFHRPPRTPIQTRCSSAQSGGPCSPTYARDSALVNAARLYWAEPRERSVRGSQSGEIRPGFAQRDPSGVRNRAQSGEIRPGFAQKRSVRGSQSSTDENRMRNPRTHRTHGVARRRDGVVLALSGLGRPAGRTVVGRSAALGERVRHAPSSVVAAKGRCGTSYPGA